MAWWSLIVDLKTLTLLILSFVLVYIWSIKVLVLFVTLVGLETSCVRPKVKVKFSYSLSTLFLLKSPIKIVSLSFLKTSIKPSNRSLNSIIESGGRYIFLVKRFALVEKSILPPQFGFHAPPGPLPFGFHAPPGRLPFGFHAPPVACHLDSTFHPGECHFDSPFHPVACHFDSTLHLTDCHFDSTLHPVACHLDSTLHPVDCHLDSTSHPDDCHFDSLLHSTDCHFEKNAPPCRLPF